MKISILALCFILCGCQRQDSGTTVDMEGIKDVRLSDGTRCVVVGNYDAVSCDWKNTP